MRPPEPLVTDRGTPPRVTVVLPAYRAASTIPAVASQMPVDVVDRALLVDDASPDTTPEVALREGFELLRLPANRGYGGNQKAGYVRALLDGADIVVMVHADNQYDPSLVERMVKPLEAGIADVVMGSRLLEDETIAGGMPRWKWVGNRALTAVENLAFRRGFSEYHTGYRAYSADFLRRVAFLRNSDDFVFDQEMFAQIVASRSHVVELPIPTRYFLEASSVSFRASVRYGVKTLWVLVRYRLHLRGRRWPVLEPPAAPLARRASATRRRPGDRGGAVPGRGRRPQHARPRRPARSSCSPPAPSRSRSRRATSAPPATAASRSRSRSLQTLGVLADAGLVAVVVREASRDAAAHGRARRQRAGDPARCSASSSSPSRRRRAGCRPTARTCARRC